MARSGREGSDHPHLLPAGSTSHLPSHHLYLLEHHHLVVLPPKRPPKTLVVVAMKTLVSAAACGSRYIVVVLQICKKQMSWSEKEIEFVAMVFCRRTGAVAMN